MNELKPYDLRERLLLLARRTIRICKELPTTPEGSRIRDQISGAVTSTAANYEEADGSYTLKDFRNKLVIARKEAREAKFFFRLLEGTYYEEEQLQEEIKELDEIIRILSKRVQNASSNNI